MQLPIKLNKIFFFIFFIYCSNLNAVSLGDLILKNQNSEVDEQHVIFSNETILIEYKTNTIGPKKIAAGAFVEFKNNYIHLETKTVFNKIILSKVHLKHIHTIYAGNVRSWRDLYSKWILYFSILTIPGSIEMAKSPYRTEIISEEVGALINWTFFTMVSSYTYAPLFSYIDFNIRKSKARKFDIHNDMWKIDKPK
mgnify:FL=1